MTHSTLRAHGSLMATDSDDQSEIDSAISAPAYSPLSVSSDSSEAQNGRNHGVGLRLLVTILTRMSDLPIND